MDLPPSQQRYLALSGTLPITFRGNTYHIPISVWLPYEYPTLRPRVRVEPTETMCVRPGRCVDPEGRVRHPYLDYWQERTAKSDLVQLINNLQTAFSDEPPVYARPAHVPFHPSSPVAKITASPVAAIQHIAQTTRAYSPRKSTPPPPAVPKERLDELRQQLRTRLRDQLGPWHAQAHQEVNQLLATSAKLAASEQDIQRIQQRLQDIKDRLRIKLDAAAQDVRSWAATNHDLEQQPPLSSEAWLMQGADSRSDALFTLNAQEHAIDDTIDQLRHALLNGRLDLQTFLKHVRRLAREQYMVKASMNKIDRITTTP